MPILTDLPVAHSGPEYHTPSSRGCCRCRIPGTPPQGLLQILCLSRTVCGLACTGALLCLLPTKTGNRDFNTDTLNLRAPQECVKL